MRGKATRSQLSERHRTDCDAAVAEHPRPELLGRVVADPDAHLAERVLRDCDGVGIGEDGLGRGGHVTHIVAHD